MPAESLDVLLLDCPKGDHERLGQILDAMPVPVSWAELDGGRILFMNRKFTQVYGYALGDFATVREWVEGAYPRPEQRARAERHWYAYFENGTADTLEIEPVEVDILCKDGALRTAILGGMILPCAGIALATFVDITEQKRNARLIERLAEEDPLTGLPNRRSFDAHLERAVGEALAMERAMHLLMLDLDHFKSVNEACGHHVGDRLLREASDRLRQCVRAGDMVARFGGDEFGIVLTHSGGNASAERVCEAVIGAMRAPFPFLPEALQVGISIGVGRLPEDARDTAGLFRAADQALLRAKREGRGRWCYER